MDFQTVNLETNVDIPFISQVSFENDTIQMLSPKLFKHWEHGLKMDACHR